MSKELDGLMKKLMAKSRKMVDDKLKEQKNKKQTDELIMKTVTDKMSLAEFSNVEKKIEGQLSEKQIENWRKALLGMIGPYALLMPKEEIQKLRNKMQQHADKLADELGAE